MTLNSMSSRCVCGLNLSPGYSRNLHFPVTNSHAWGVLTILSQQRIVFDAPLQQQELEGIKAMVREHSTNGATEQGITEAGFLYLHTMFIQRGRLETTWTVLRKFGYGEDLRLTEAFLYPKYVHVKPICARP